MKTIRSKQYSHLIALSAALTVAMAPTTFGDNRKLIETLVENGHLTEEQAEGILREERPSVLPAGLNFKDFQIRGRIQTQFGYTHAESDAGSEDYSTLELRRVRLGVRGTLLQDVRAQLEANLVPGDGLSMRSAFLQWRKYDAAHIKVGYDTPAFGFERTRSSASIYTVERSHVTNTIISDDLTGISLEGKRNRFRYGAGIYTNDDNGNPGGESARYLYNGSVGLHLDDLLPEEQTLRLRADLILNDDGDGAFGYEEGYSVSAHYGRLPFELQAEFLHAEHFDGDSTSGWYLLPSYFVTDNFQLVGRYEQMRSDDGAGIRSPSRYLRRAEGFDIRGDRYRALYAGANYYFSGDANKVMFGVELAELETDLAGVGDADAVTVYSAWRVLF